MTAAYSPQIDIWRLTFLIIVNFGVLIYFIYYAKIFSNAHKNLETNKLFSGLSFMSGFVCLFITCIAVDGTYSAWDSTYIVDFLLLKDLKLSINERRYQDISYTLIMIGVMYFTAYIVGIYKRSHPPPVPPTKKR